MNAQEYLALAEQRKQEKVEKGEVITIDLPSGAVFKALPLKIEQFAIGGRLPTQLIQQIRKNRGEAAGAQLSEDQIISLGIKSMEMVREFLLSNVIEPKITLEGIEGSITPEQIDPDDFSYLMDWCISGGQAEANLKSPKRAAGRKRAA